MNSLWSFGCSFTAEYHPVNCNPPNNYDLFREYRGKELPDVWPTILSEKLEYKNENKGIGASSNYSIFYQFCDFCKNFKKGDIIIVGWTSIYRFLLANPQTQHLSDVLPSPEYEWIPRNIQEWIHVNRTEETWYSEIVYFTKIILEMCNDKGVHVFFWSFENNIPSYVTSKLFSEGYETIENNFIMGETPQLPIKTDIEFGHYGNVTIKDETNGEVDDVHYGELGHKLQAEFFYNKINNYINELL